ncbi:MAG: hypothetical protein ACLFVO_02290 [Chloroflexaceae bacterium]
MNVSDSRSTLHIQRWMSPAVAGRWSLVAGHLLLGLVIGAYLAYFAAHAWLVLHYPYPLDYGEGPLLAQVDLLRAGLPIWELYADPAAPPYAVVNYPPLYPLLAEALSHLTGDVLLAGRLLALLATLGCVGALTLLIAIPARLSGTRLSGAWFFLPLSFLAIPIVREWAVSMRVDMPGVCLGLWGLVALQLAVGTGQPRGRRLWALLAAILFLLTLYTKPSLIAAPAAGLAWLALLLLQPANRRPYAIRSTFLIVIAVLSVSGALLFGLLHRASAGWFALHVVEANANRWEFDLARQFWTDVARLHWPLALAALLSVLFIFFLNRNNRSEHSSFLLLPMLYTLGGVVTAAGVGKVGAYTNYFLELYAGLIWLVGTGYWLLATGQREMRGYVSITGRWALLMLLMGALAYYPPTWSPTSLHRAGLLEPSPPRMAFGQYNLWDDTQRAATVLAALERVHTALTAEVRAAGPVIFTDIPGVAAQADRLSRYQAFEQRQLLDQGYLEQRQLLLELANGEIPLAVIDFLGNWLTPEMVELLQRRYAQDGALGTLDRYRPVAPGPRTPLDQTFDAGLRLTGYHLAAPAGRTGRQFDAGALLVATLEWERDTHAPTADIAVLLQLTDRTGRVVTTTERPLLYGVLPPAQWPAGSPVQHMQPLRLPPDLPPGRYGLTLALQPDGQASSPSRAIGRIRVRVPRGRYFAETNYFVPAPLLRAWEASSGLERAGYPLTPAVPFAWGTLQCFERTCLEWRDGRVAQRALGTEHYLAETLRSTTCGTRQPATIDPSHPTICPAFAEVWTDYGGMATLGPALSGELLRSEHIVQWTRYARLERLPESDQVHLGRIGDEALRLPPGMRYRWP